MIALQLIGLDVGTTSCKAGAFDTNGRLLALASAAYGVERPRPGFVEQPVERYWDAAATCLRELLAAPGVAAGRVAALSSCGQAPTLVLLDADGRPVRDAILWQDTRAASEAESLARDPGAEVLAEWLGMRWPVDASLPLAKLLWLRRHEPAMLAKAAVALQPKDYVHLRLTGRASSDPWSARGLVHQASRRPVPALRTLVGLNRDIVPPVVPSATVVGHVNTAGAAATGLPAGLPVVAGWTDAMSAMLGSGAFGRVGLAADVSGTSEVIGLCTSSAPADPTPLVVAPVVDTGRYAIYGPTQASGGSLGWALRALATEPLDVDAALAAAAGVPAGADGLVFLPYLEGERAPIWDARARGALIGLTSRHTQAHLIRAVLEGVACSVWHVLHLAESLAGSPAGEVRVAGGGARLALWNQIKADVAGRPVRPCATTENGVLGAAMLAAAGAGIFPDVTAAGEAMVNLLSPQLPDPGQRTTYDQLFARYIELYPRLRGVFDAA